MMRSLLILLFLVTTLPCEVVAEKKNLGVGIIVGDPIRLTAKKWLSRTTAIDAAFSHKATRTGSSSPGTFEIHVDYLKHNFNLLRLRSGLVPVHYGLGFRVRHDDEFKTNLRLPVGASFLFRNAPVGIFFEYALLLDLSAIKSETALGFRYYF